MAKWIQLLVTGITVGSIYSLIALGYVTIYKTSRIVNMAQGAFVMFGAFFAYSFLSEVGLPYWLAALLSIVCVVVLGVVMYLLVLRPLVKISLVSIILATLALSILFENLALLKWGGYGKSVPAFTGDKAIFIGKVAIFPQSLWVIGLMVLVLVGLYVLINLTRIGKQMTATANDPGAAGLSGVNTGRMILLAFAISAAIGALGGIAVTPINSTSYLSGGIYALSGFVAAILGGWGSSVGAVVGGLVLGIVQSLVTGLLPAGYQDAIAYLILILILYFRPGGILNQPSAEGEA